MADEPLKPTGLEILGAFVGRVVARVFIAFASVFIAFDDEVEAWRKERER